MVREWEPEIYRKSATLQWTLAQELMAKEIVWRGDEKVLDIGCGDGLVSASIAEKIPRGSVHGIDFSNEMIRHATETHQKLTNLTFSVNSAETITEVDKYDVVVSFSTLQWVKRLDIVAANIHRCLKKGGKTVMFFYSHLFFYYNLNQRVAKQAFWQEHFKNYADNYAYYDADALRIFLIQQQFNINRVDNVAKEWCYQSMADYRFFTQGYSPYYRFLSNPQLKEKFLDDVCTELLKFLHVNQDGSVIVPFHVVEGVASK